MKLGDLPLTFDNPEDSQNKLEVFGIVKYTQRSMNTREEDSQGHYTAIYRRCAL